MEKKFKILRLIGSIYKILGIIAAVLTIVGSLGICVTSVAGSAFMETFEDQLGTLISGTVAGIIAAGVTLLYGAIMALMLYGLGEGMFLLISLEENTRKTAHYMQQYSNEPLPPAV